MKHMIVFILALAGLSMFMDGCITVERPLHLSQTVEDADTSKS